jgi:hypothetical protein
MIGPTEFIKIEHPDGSVEYLASNADELIALSKEAEKNSIRLELTPEQVAESILNQQKYEARQYLASTDWYAARLAETGTAIPADVLAQRQQARALLSS